MTFDIDKIVWEMKSVMSNNCSGTPEERFYEAKDLLKEQLDKVIEDNREDLIEELEE